MEKLPPKVFFVPTNNSVQTGNIWAPLRVHGVYVLQVFRACLSASLVNESRGAHTRANPKKYRRLTPGGGSAGAALAAAEFILFFEHIEANGGAEWRA